MCDEGAGGCGGFRRGAGCMQRGVLVLGGEVDWEILLECAAVVPNKSSTGACMLMCQVGKLKCCCAWQAPAGAFVSELLTFRSLQGLLCWWCCHARAPSSPAGCCSGPASSVCILTAAAPAAPGPRDLRSITSMRLMRMLVLHSAAAAAAAGQDGMLRLEEGSLK